LVRVLGDALERLFDARERSVARTSLAVVEVAASLLEFSRSEAAEANGPRQPDDGGSGRRAFRFARNILPRASGLAVLVERLKPQAQLRFDLRRDRGLIRVGAGRDGLIARSHDAFSNAAGARAATSSVEVCTTGFSQPTLGRARSG